MSPRPHLATLPAHPTPAIFSRAVIAPAALQGFPPLAHRPTSVQPKQSFGQPASDWGLTIAEIERLIEHYLVDCELRLLSPRTVETRRVFFRNWTWFLRHRGYRMCGAAEIRQFLHYLGHGHEDDGGRFGKASLRRAARPVTVFDYYVCLRSFYDWLTTQRIIQATPFATIPKPQVREESKTPLSTEQIAALFKAASDSANPARNKAVLALLLDTGCRASEFVTMRVKDLDLANGRCRVLGKGDKYRTLFFGASTARILSEYFQHPAGKAQLKEAVSNPECPLFSSVRGGESLTRSGLLHMLKRLGKRAGIRDEVSVHALRRSFAVQMLKNGANVFSVQAMLGHSTLTQTRKYCVLALADAEAQHRQFSPMDRFAPMSSRTNSQ